jgi:hypothetical protein
VRNGLGARIEGVVQDPVEQFHQEREVLHNPTVNVVGEAGRVWRPDHNPAIYTSLRLVGFLAAILIFQRNGGEFDVGLEELSLGNGITILIKDFEVLYRLT